MGVGVLISMLIVSHCMAGALVAGLGQLFHVRTCCYSRLQLPSLHMHSDFDLLLLTRDGEQSHRKS